MKCTHLSWNSIFNNSNARLCKSSWLFFHLLEHIGIMLNVLMLGIILSFILSLCKLLEFLVKRLPVLLFLFLLLLLQSWPFLLLLVLEEFGLKFEVFSRVLSALLFRVESVVFGLGLSFNIVKLLVNMPRSIVKIPSNMSKSLVANLSIGVCFVVLLGMQVREHVLVREFLGFVGGGRSLACVDFLLHVLAMEFLEKSLLFSLFLLDCIVFFSHFCDHSFSLLCIFKKLLLVKIELVVILIMKTFRNCLSTIPKDFVIFLPSILVDVKLIDSSCTLFRMHVNVISYQFSLLFSFQINLSLLFILNGSGTISFFF